jgi:hypothetical protein
MQEYVEHVVRGFRQLRRAHADEERIDRHATLQGDAFERRQVGRVDQPKELLDPWTRQVEMPRKGGIVGEPQSP